MELNDKLQCKFLKVTSIEMAKYLMDCGYQCISNDADSWTFLNSNKYLFTDNRIVYTNNLYI